MDVSTTRHATRVNKFSRARRQCVHAVAALWSAVGLTATLAPLSAANAAPSGQYVYAYNNQALKLATYKADDSTGALTLVDELQLDEEATEFVVDAPRRLAWLANPTLYVRGQEPRDNVRIFKVLDDGTLSPVGTTYTNQFSGDLAVHPSGKFAYATQPKSYEDLGPIIYFKRTVINTFAINDAGRFTLTSQSPAVTQAIVDGQLIDTYSNSFGLSFSKDGKYLLKNVSQMPQLVSYAISADNGSLKERSRINLRLSDPTGTPVSTASLLTVPAFGDYVYLNDYAAKQTEGQSLIRPVRLDQNGTLSENAVQWGASVVAISRQTAMATPDGKKLYHATDFALSGVPVSPSTGRVGQGDTLFTDIPSASVMTDDGRFIYLATYELANGGVYRDFGINAYSVAKNGDVSQVGRKLLTGPVISIMRTARFSS